MTFTTQIDVPAPTGGVGAQNPSAERTADAASHLKGRCTLPPDGPCTSTKQKGEHMVCRSHTMLQFYLILTTIFFFIPERLVATDECCDYSPPLGCISSPPGGGGVSAAVCAETGGVFMTDRVCSFATNNCELKPGGGSLTCVDVPQDVCAALAGGPLIIPMLSQWGLAWMALMLLGVGLILLIRQRVTVHERDS